jgi:hypothetical protein
MDVKDLRAAERYVLVETLSGSFGATSVTLLNIGMQGVRVEHAQPLGINTKARLSFTHGEVAVNTQGIVRWSHLSRTPNGEGKLLYHSGVAFSGDDELRRALRALAARGAIKLDADSMQRKRERLLQKAQERSGKPIMKMLRTDSDVPADQALLIQHARQRLAANPDEASKWYNRARFAITEDTAAAELARHRQDVLAVWEYLERSVELAMIVKVFDRG